METSRNGGTYWINSESQHPLVCGPERSGKSACIVIPNLLAWQGSALVMDPSGEAFELTSGARAEAGHAVFRFSPGDRRGCSHRFNPLDSVSEDPIQRRADLRRIASILLPVPFGAVNSFWIEEAQSLFVGVALGVLERDDAAQRTLGEVYRTITNARALDGLLLERSASGSCHPDVEGALACYRDKAEKERSGIRATLADAMQLWANPVVDAATAKSDFNVQDLKRTRTTIYAVDALELREGARLLHLLLEDALVALSRGRSHGAYESSVLVLLDDAARLGRIGSLIKALGELDPREVRLCTIVQLRQLEVIYGAEGSAEILGRCSPHVLLGPVVDEATRRHLGGTELGADEVLVAGGSPEIRPKRGYFEDERFAQRILPSIEVPCVVAAAVDGPSGQELESEPADSGTLLMLLRALASQARADAQMGLARAQGYDRIHADLQRDGDSVRATLAMREVTQVP